MISLAIFATFHGASFTGSKRTFATSRSLVPNA